MSQPNQTPNSNRRIHVRWLWPLHRNSVTRAKKKYAAKKALNKQEHKQQQRQRQQKPKKVTTLELCVQSACVLPMITAPFVRISSSLTLSSSLNAGIVVAFHILLLLLFSFVQTLTIHSMEKHPRLPSAPNYFFKFCGNSVEIHVPTISLITAYRCADTHACSYIIHTNTLVLYRYKNICMRYTKQTHIHLCLFLSSSCSHYYRIHAHRYTHTQFRP